ncbi:MAG: hypothetical protein ACQEUT_18365 [Bacillota bacterium]
MKEYGVVMFLGVNNQRYVTTVVASGEKEAANRGIENFKYYSQKHPNIYRYTPDEVEAKRESVHVYLT